MEPEINVEKSQEEINALSVLLNTTGWQTVVLPSLIKNRDSHIVALINNQHDAGELRGYIKAMTWMLEWPNRLTSAVTELRAMRESVAPDDVEDAKGTIY